MPNYMFDLSVDRVDLVTEGANSEAMIKIFKSKNEGGTAMNYEEILASLKPEHRDVIKSEMDKLATLSPEDQAKVDEFDTLNTDLAKAKEELVNLQKELEETKKSVDEDVAKGKPDMEDVIKGLDPAVQEVFKSLKAQKEAAEEVLKSAQKEKLHAEAIAKAKELKALPVEENTLVSVIEKGVSPEVMNIFTAAAKAFGDSDLFKSKGSDIGNSSTGTDAWAKIEAKASEIAKSRNITVAKATDVAIKENPDLYKEYLDNGAN